MATKNIQNVAVAGVNGNLGPAVLHALTTSGLFKITIFTRLKAESEAGTRSPSSASAPIQVPAYNNSNGSDSGNSIDTPKRSIQTVQVNYDSVDDLTTHLTAHSIHAVVSLLPHTAPNTQTNLIQAAVAAGVYRFIPSEFGSDLDNPVNRAAPTYKGKVTIQELLKGLAAENKISYTIIYNGAFLDWGLTHGFPIDLEKRTAVLYDGGERVYSTTTQQTIGHAVVSVLANPEETKNRVVRIAEANVTIKQLLSLVQEVVGDKDWTVTETDIDQEIDKAWALIKKGVFSFESMMPFIYRAGWGKDAGGHFETTDNILLGVNELDAEGVKSVIEGVVKKLRDEAFSH
ncbi:aromatic alcohol reductase [Aspergillus foveolatus]|uniref:aromatic alcohol reductase n=1 Tax=Aspergillus foveolatus TaxID=210207 RepID=UPI003CCDB50E